MSNLEKQNNQNSNSLPFSLNWKDILMIGLFLVGAGGIIYSIRQTEMVSETGVSSNLIEKVDNQQIAQVENPVVKHAGTSLETPQVQAPINNTPETRSIEASPSSQVRKVESPLSGIDAKVATTKPINKEVAETEEPMVAKNIDAAEEKSERALILATDVKARTGAPITPPTTAKTEKPVAYTPSKTAGNGNFFLIAASRSNMQEAMKAVEDLKSQGFAKPIILEPSKEAGTTNFRIAVYRDVDRVKVDEYKNANADKVGSYWVWQKK